MKRSGANEDTFSLPVISALDAELTYLQRPPLCGRLERPPLCGRLDGRRCHNSFQSNMNMSGCAIIACVLAAISACASLMCADLHDMSACS